MFFVEDSRIANQLKRLGKLESRDGTLLVIVKPCPPPRGAEDGDQRQPRYIYVHVHVHSCEVTNHVYLYGFVNGLSQ